ncbi:MAG: response regulator [Archangium sp.]|nr:response regulator [Archangium sp.]MDP3576207.1 response regulator [Archangium sp.]
MDRQGYRVLEASNAAQAMLMSERHEGHIDLMLSDVVMPAMSGRKLHEQLAPKRPKMKILFMSGYTDDTVVQHGVETRQVAFLPKTFEPKALLAKVREVLGRSVGKS